MTKRKYNIKKNNLPDIVTTFYLNVESNNFTKPNYKNSRVYASKNVLNQNNKVFYSTPLYSFLPKGNLIPDFSNIDYVSFLFFPSIVSNFNTYFEDIISQCWFSIGLANLVIFSSENNWGTINEKINSLYNSGLLTAVETWNLQNSKIVDTPDLKCPKNDTSDTISLDTFPETIPLDVEFVLNELIGNLNYLVHSSKIYTPHYYSDHKNLYNFVMNEISILLSDIKKPNGDKFSTSDGYGRMVQFNSVLTYVLNQIFTGVLPILHNRAFFNRYSLLGSGTAVNGLFELSIQLEEIFNLNILEDIQVSDYAFTEIPLSELSELLSVTKIDLYNENSWKNDTTRKALITKISNIKANIDQKDNFTRLAFFSGRYGFREYELSASSATQVLVEGSTTKWHVLNYTHEVIHNHVRIILNKLLLFTNSNDPDFVTKLSKLIDDIFKAREQDLGKITYLQYFKIIFGNYIIMSELYGSLSIPSPCINNVSQSTGIKRLHAHKPTPSDYFKRCRLLYTDLSEILTHCFDYAYVYSYDSDIYIRSIWQSWSEIPSIYDDLEQYILRSLLILSQKEEGETFTRYDQSIKHFLRLITKQFKGENDKIIEKINKTLEANEFNLKSRFKNCILISDLTFNFFTLDLNWYFGKSDKYHSRIKNSFVYEYDCPILKQESDCSKIRMSFSELHKIITQENVQLSNKEIERQTAWLFLMLSNNNI